MSCKTCCSSRLVIGALLVHGRGLKKGSMGDVIANRGGGGGGGGAGGTSTLALHTGKYEQTKYSTSHASVSRTRYGVPANEDGCGQWEMVAGPC